MFHISFFYVLLYVPYMQNCNNKKYMLDAATSAKLGVKWPICSNRDLFWNFHIYHYCLMEWHSIILSNFKSWSRSLEDMKKQLCRGMEVPPKGALTKNFVLLSRFWPLRRWGRGVWLNLLNKENSWRKSFLQLMLNDVLKNCQKWYLLIWKLI